MPAGSTKDVPAARVTKDNSAESCAVDTANVPTKGLRDSIAKGMRIISDIEQTRADGMVFKYELDLMYELVKEKATPRAPPGLCLANCQRAACENTEVPNGLAFCCCAKCGAKYCCRDCQVRDWKTDHKAMCSQLRDLRAGAGAVREGGTLDRQSVVARVLGKVRLYLCPFAVCHGQAQGRGFVFVQTPNPVLELAYLRPVNSNGQRIDRSLILHFLSMGEFVDAVMQDDFELGAIRTPLEAAVDAHNPKDEVVVLVRARCGYMAVVIVPMVPNFVVCRQLGTDYVEKSAVQLNLDDT